MHAAEQTEYPQNIHNPTTILAKAISCLCIRRGKVLQRYNIQSEQPRTEISKDISWGDTGKGFHFVLSVPSLWACTQSSGKAFGVRRKNRRSKKVLCALPGCGLFAEMA